MGLTSRRVICSNGKQPRKFALAAGVRLQRHCVVSRELHQHGFEFRHDLERSRHLIHGGKRMQIAQLGPRDGHHLGGGVELHGATAQWDHGPIHGQILVGQAT